MVLALIYNKKFTQPCLIKYIMNALVASLLIMFKGGGSLLMLITLLVHYDRDYTQDKTPSSGRERVWNTTSSSKASGEKLRGSIGMDGEPDTDCNQQSAVREEASRAIWSLRESCPEEDKFCQNQQHVQFYPFSSCYFHCEHTGQSCPPQYPSL